MKSDRRIRDIEGRIVKITGPWVPFTFINSWANYGGALQACAACRDSAGFIHLRGMTARGVAGFALPITTLSAAFRPAKEVSFACVGNNKFCRVAINAAGEVYVSAADSATPEAFVSLDGISFDPRA